MTSCLDSAPEKMTHLHLRALVDGSSDLLCQPASSDCERIAYDAELLGGDHYGHYPVHADSVDEP